MAKTAGLEASSISELEMLAESGSIKARDLIQRSGLVLGRGLGTLANMLDPEAIILGGGTVLASAIYRDGVAQGLASAIWPATRDVPKLVLAGCGPDAGLIGAALSK